MCRSTLRTTAFLNSLTRCSTLVHYQYFSVLDSTKGIQWNPWNYKVDQFCSCCSEGFQHVGYVSMECSFYFTQNNHSNMIYKITISQCSLKWAMSGVPRNQQKHNLISVFAKLQEWLATKLNGVVQLQKIYLQGFIKWGRGWVLVPPPFESSHQPYT